MGKAACCSPKPRIIKTGMSRETRRVKLEEDLERLQSTFKTQLLEALRVCAAGQWGLFGQNDETLKTAFGSNHRYISQDAQDLLSLGDKIADLRAQLGYTDSYALYERFLAVRNDRESNALGESKRAQRFLDELASQLP